jgi:hypothetical protein
MYTATHVLNFERSSTITELVPAHPRMALKAPMQNLLADIRFALRQFRLSPVFTLTAIVTLALGIGGTTAIFSLIHAVMLRSLPVADPTSLYRIGEGNDCCVEGGPQNSWGMFSFHLYERLAAAAPEFEEVAPFRPVPGARAFGVIVSIESGNLCTASS